MKRLKKIYTLRYCIKDENVDRCFRLVDISACSYPEAIGTLNALLRGFYKHYVIAFKHFKVTF